MPDLDRLRAYAELDQEIKDIGKRDKELRSQRAAMCQEIYEEMSQEGMLSTKILPAGWERAVSISTTCKIRASIPADSRIEVCGLLKENGHGAIVKESVHPGTLNSWVGELPKDREGMPILDPDLVGRITIFEQFGLSVRKA
jgi:hypothetical protein